MDNSSIPPLIKIDKMKLCGPAANEDMKDLYQSSVTNPHPHIGDFDITCNALSHICVLCVKVMSLCRMSSIMYTAS